MADEKKPASSLKSVWDAWSGLNNKVASVVVPGLLIPFLVVVPGSYSINNPDATVLELATSFHSSIISGDAWIEGFNVWGTLLEAFAFDLVVPGASFVMSAVENTFN